jgi:hypothetical protein
MKKQLLAMLALMSATTHNAQAQTGQTFVDTFKLLGSRFPTDLNYNVLRTGCAQSYDWLRTSCLNLPVVAHNPAFQKIVKENFAAISSLVGVLGAVFAYWSVQQVWQWNVRRKDNNFREAYRHMKPEERTALLLIMLNQLPQLLDAIPNRNEVSALMKYSGVPLSFKVPGYSQNALDITVTGDTVVQPIRLNIENHLGCAQDLYHFTSPYFQNAINTNIGSLRTLLSKDNAHLIERMANVLANLPAQNYYMSKKGSLTAPDLNRNVLSVLESDAVAKAIYELEKQPEDLNDRCKRLTVDSISPFVTLHLESTGNTDIVELTVVDNVSGRAHSFIIEDAPVLPSQQAAGPSNNHTRQVTDTRNTQRKESGLDRLKRGWRGGTVSSGRIDTTFLRTLKADGLINVIHSAVTDKPTLQKAYVVEIAPNSWEIRVPTNQQEPTCSSNILPTASNASSSNAQVISQPRDRVRSASFDGSNEHKWPIEDVRALGHRRSTSFESRLMQDNQQSLGIGVGLDSDDD